MSTRILVAIAVLAGLVTGLVLLALVVAVTPAQNHAAVTPALPVVSPSPSPSPTPSPTPSPSPTPAPTPSPSASENVVAPPTAPPPTAVPTPTPTRTPVRTPTPKPTKTPVLTPSPVALAPVAVRRASRRARRRDDVTSVRALAARVAEPPGRILVITDFDGTISEIDPDPMGARILPLARRALRRLARIAEERPDRLALAILTGRAVDDAAVRARVGGVRYLGNHGIDAGWLARRGSVRGLVARSTGSGEATAAARLGAERGCGTGRSRVAVRRGQGRLGRLPLPPGAGSARGGSIDRPDGR